MYGGGFRSRLPWVCRENHRPRPVCTAAGRTEERRMGNVESWNCAAAGNRGVPPGEGPPLGSAPHRPARPRAPGETERTPPSRSDFSREAQPGSRHGSREQRRFAALAVQTSNGTIKENAPTWRNCYTARHFLRRRVTRSCPVPPSRTRRRRVRAFAGFPLHFKPASTRRAPSPGSRGPADQAGDKRPRSTDTSQAWRPRKPIRWARAARRPAGDR